MVDSLQIFQMSLSFVFEVPLLLAVNKIIISTANLNYNRETNSEEKTSAAEKVVVSLLASRHFSLNEMLAYPAIDRLTSGQF